MPMTKNFLGPYQVVWGCPFLEERAWSGALECVPSATLHVSSSFFHASFLLLMFHVACGILVPQPGIELASPACPG